MLFEKTVNSKKQEGGNGEILIHSVFWKVISISEVSFNIKCEWLSVSLKFILVYFPQLQIKILGFLSKRIF